MSLVEPLSRCVDQFDVGLLQSKIVKIAAVSPDGVGVITCTRPDDNDESVLANDVRKLFAFFASQNHLSEVDGAPSEDAESTTGETSPSDEESEAPRDIEKEETLAFVSAFEFKHHSSVLTVSETRSIVSTSLNNHRVRVLDLRVDHDKELF